MITLGINLIGADGSTWDLVSGPVRTTVAGIKGLGMPEVDDQTRQTALQDGQTLTGWRLQPRTVWLPLKFHAEANVDVEGVQRAFWRAVPIGEIATLIVTDGSGATRSLGIRFQDDGGIAYKVDPYLYSPTFGVTFIADRPWWEGPAQTTYYSLGEAGAVDFFGGTGGPPFFISSSQGSGSSTLSNPGDQPAWIEWTVSGPISDFRAGVSGHYVGGPIAVGAGNLLRIETDPLRQVAYLDAVKVTRELTEIDWVPVPRGSSVPIDISLVGSGIVTATIRPKYARAL